MLTTIFSALLVVAGLAVGVGVTFVGLVFEVRAADRRLYEADREAATPPTSTPTPASEQGAELETAPSASRDRVPISA